MAFQAANVNAAWDHLQNHPQRDVHGIGRARGGRGRGAGRGRGGNAPAGRGRGDFAGRGRGDRDRGARGRGAGRGRGGRGGGAGHPGDGAPPVPVPAPAPVLPPAPPEPRPSRDAVINRWLSQFRPRVARVLHEAAQAAFPGVNFIVDDTGVRGVNPHELLAIGRVIATARALATLALEHRSNTVQHIDFLWGANRDVMVLGLLNNALRAQDYEEIEGHLIGEQVLAADQHRRPIAVEGPHSPYGLVVNVYCHGEDSAEVTPSWLATLGYAHLAWVGHRFEDLYGVVLTAYWLRVPGPKGPLIKWYSDEVNPEYPPHPPCDLMHSAGAHLGSQWHTVGTITCAPNGASRSALKPIYDIVLVSARVARESALTSIRESRQIVMEMDIPDITGYLNWVRLTTPSVARATAVWAAEYLFSWGLLWTAKTRVVLQKNDFHTAVRFLSNKGRQQYSFRALQTEIDRFLTDAATHADFIYLERMAPEYFLHYRWNLALAAFTYNAEAQALQLQGVQQVYGASFDAANRAVRGIDTPVNVASSNVGWKLAGVVAGHWVLTKIPGVRDVYASIWRTVGRAVARTFGVRASGAGDRVTENVVWARAHAHSLVDRTSNGVTRLWGNIVSGWNTGRAAYAQARAEATETIERHNAAIAPEFDANREAIRSVARGTNFKPEDSMMKVFTFSCLSLYGFSALLVAPVLEEGVKHYAKRWGPKVHIGVCIYLACADAYSDCNPDAVPLLSIPIMTAVHYYLSRGSYGRNVRNHFLWNLGAIGLRVLCRGLTNRPLLASSGFLDTLWGELSSFWQDMIVPIGLCASLAVFLYSRRRKAVNTNPVEEFDRQWYTRPGDPPKKQEILVIDDTRLVVRIPEAHRYVGPHTSIELGEVVIDDSVKIIAHPTPFAAPEDNVGAGYYRIWGHNAPMFRPSGAAENLKAVVFHRLAVAVPFRAREEAWWLVNMLTAGKAQLLPFHMWPAVRDDWDEHPLIRVPDRAMASLDRRELVARWLEHTDPAKRERYLAALEIVNVCPLSISSSKVRNVAINVKRDEVLLKYRLKPEDKGTIPRPIHNVDPQLAVTVGPDVYAASEVLKKHWRWDSEFQKRGGFAVNMRLITITYGAGLLSDELDAWFAFVLTEPGYHILVAGDDSIVTINHQGSSTFVEGDISKCDHSVRQLALKYEYFVLRSAGLHHDAEELLDANSKATCVAGARMPDGGTMRIARGPERNTGGVDTTVGNTIVTGGGHFLACATCPIGGTEKEIESHFTLVFATLGLSLKTRVWRGRISELGSTFWGPSFLKGYWYPSTSEPTQWRWGPLPSRMLKISKIMPDPRRVYRKRGEKDVPYTVACHRHIAALYLGLRPYAWPEELLEWLRARADPAWTVHVPLEEWDGVWRPRGRAESVSVSPQWVAQAAWWYATDEAEVLDWLDQLRTFGVGAFSFHPFWVKMALKDYN